MDQVMERLESLLKDWQVHEAVSGRQAARSM
jgi:hypothetical protein